MLAPRVIVNLAASWIWPPHFQNRSVGLVGQGIWNLTLIIVSTRCAQSASYLPDRSVCTLQVTFPPEFFIQNSIAVRMIDYWTMQKSIATGFVAEATRYRSQVAKRALIRTWQLDRVCKLFASRGRFQLVENMLQWVLLFIIMYFTDARIWLKFEEQRHIVLFLTLMIC